LPREVIGGLDNSSCKKDLMQRICNLDPNGIFLKKYQKTIESEVGIGSCNIKKDHPLTLMFAIGGAGAQHQLAIDILASLKTRLKCNGFIVRMMAGTKKEVAKEIAVNIKKLGMQSLVGKNLFIDSYKDRPTYFKEFNKLLRKTDIMWTKPSEMSFYCALGMPILMAPTIGSQEDFNKTWLMYIGAGVEQADPKHTNEWLFDWIDSGGFARAAWNGYMEAPQHGSYRIEGIVTGNKMEVEELPMIV
jgi:hypothetical protein